MSDVHISVGDLIEMIEEKLVAPIKSELETVKQETDYMRSRVSQIEKDHREIADNAEKFWEDKLRGWKLWRKWRKK